VHRNLTIEELGDLVELPLLAILATHRKDGGVLLSPVWHEWRDGGFSVVTGSRGIKTQHLRRDSRVSIVVAEQTPPYRGVEVDGDARLTTDGVAEAARRIATRYLGEEGGAAYADGAADDQLIRIEPGRLRGWDFADDFAT
jgi:PPOX class probable F420-dependent enzyme